MIQLLSQFGVVDRCDASHGFFGLVPWYHYLPPTIFDTTAGHSCDIVNFDIWSQTPLILLAVIDDLLRIAGVVAIGYVIFGAIQYITSQGSPDATAKAQATVINALIGVAIAVVSVGFVSFLGSKLGG